MLQSMPTREVTGPFAAWWSARIPYAAWRPGEMHFLDGDLLRRRPDPWIEVDVAHGSLQIVALSGGTLPWRGLRRSRNPSAFVLSKVRQLQEHGRFIDRDPAGRWEVRVLTYRELRDTAGRFAGLRPANPNA